MKYRIGVDIGGTTIKAGLVDEQFRIVERMAIPTLSEEGADDGVRVANGIVKLVRDLCAKKGVPEDSLEGVGVCCPGSVDAEGANRLHRWNRERCGCRGLWRIRCGLGCRLPERSDDYTRHWSGRRLCV